VISIPDPEADPEAEAEAPVPPLLPVPLAPVLLVLEHAAARGSTSSPAAIHIFLMQVVTARPPERLARIE
jgi:hypothetical protein